MTSRHAKMLTCAGCGIQIVKRPRADRRPYCTSCAMERVRLAALAMATKSGPEYERWLRSNGPTGGQGAPRKRKV